MISAFVLLAVGMALLYWGAERVVRHSSSLARGLGVSSFIIGSTVVAFGSSAPELLVSTMASLEKNGAIALGNVIGSNIANIGLILGLSVFVLPPKPDGKAVKREFPFLLVVTAMLFLMSLDGTLGRVDAVVLMVSFLSFVLYNIRSAQLQMAGNISGEDNRGKGTIYDLVLSVVGLIVLLVGSHLLVRSAAFIATALGVSQMVIGLSMVAVGTSLPELTIAVIACVKKEQKINLGMILGSNIFNTLLVLGVASFILPITIDRTDAYIYIPIMFLFSLGMFPAIRRNVKMHRLVGFFLLVGYFCFIFYSFAR